MPEFLQFGHFLVCGFSCLRGHCLEQDSAWQEVVPQVGWASVHVPATTYRDLCLLGLQELQTGILSTEEVHSVVTLDSDSAFPVVSFCQNSNHTSVGVKGSAFHPISKFKHGFLLSCKPPERLTYLLDFVKWLYTLFLFSKS